MKQTWNLMVFVDRDLLCLFLLHFINFCINSHIGLQQNSKRCGHLIVFTSCREKLWVLPCYRMCRVPLGIWLCVHYILNFAVIKDFMLAPCRISAQKNKYPENVGASKKLHHLALQSMSNFFYTPILFGRYLEIFR